MSSERIRLTVLGISYSQIQSGAYALILAQENGPYRIPVVIGAAEAQSIAMRMESITPPRPMTHDLFVSFAHAFGVRLKEVFIYRFEDGIFSSELTFASDDRVIRIDSRTSDAIAIAMRTGSPIYTTPEILKETGFLMDTQTDDTDREDEEAADGAPVYTDDSDTPDETDSDSPYSRLENFTIEELERTLNRLIDKEQYEEAARVNEILKRKRSNNKA
ncbi:MAG: bifunctional nuclease family protein [Muribaculaceae bacterium]|nr:bifunctional nuclease family protein [Muribaculaceae bacterium]